MTIDFSRWAVVSFHDDSGLGRQAQDIKKLLGFQHLAVPTDRLTTHPMVEGRDHRLTKDLDEASLQALLGRFEGILVLERWGWHPDLLRVAKQAGVKIAAYVNWEWFRGTDPQWKLVDLFVCPTPFAVSIVQSYGLGPAVYVPWALDISRFEERVVRGPARVFFHNAGLVDGDDHKGTRDTIEAFMRVKNPELRLIVRMQKPTELPVVDQRVDIRVGNLPDPAALFAEGDVAIQPSKMEGCGLGVLEPVCIGFPVITTDYPPMSDHVRQPEMRARKKWFKRYAFPKGAAKVMHAHLRLPSIRDLARRIEWCAAHDMEPVSRQNRRHGLDVYGPAPLHAAWEKALASIR